MSFDFSKIQVAPKESLPVDPIELFQKLKVSDTGINDLWLAQGDALREWHKERKKKDLGVVLNTGAGKTLVGLLIAQSLVNETRGRVMYACSSIQLVEQTAEKAKGYGLNVTCYFKGQYSNDLFTRGLAPCITTYQALFNGRSKFFREEISGVVFDDAHAAEHLLRDHFSLRINRNDFTTAYDSIVSLFRGYHQTIGKSGSYDELYDQSSRKVFLIPPFEIDKQLEQIRLILRTARLSKNDDTTFAWEHVKDRIDLCCILISTTEITITPPFVPVLNLPYFKGDTRRIYLSATLTAPDAFARTFGRAPESIIAPSTTAGECERLIVVASRQKSCTDDIEVTKEVVWNYKTLVLVPTYPRSNKWKNMAVPPAKENVSEAVNAFKADRGIPKLILAARYDGVDLPGDTCRVMVIDDLPMGVGPLERFMWENLRLSNTLRTAIASRIIQSFGRISRGMSDHGVVFLTGEKLVDWLMTPRNSAILPAFLQKQLQLGFDFSDKTESVNDLRSATAQCLARDKNWMSFYDNFMQNAREEESDEDTELLKEIAESEAKFIYYLWDRKYNEAAKIFSDTLERAFALSASTGAWHALWLGKVLEILGDHDLAVDLYARAHASQLNIPAYPKDGVDNSGADTPEQVAEVYRQLRIDKDGRVFPPKSVDKDLALLNGSGSFKETEEALRALGQYLGLISTRPDKEFGTGPDVLWRMPDGTALCIEVKTEKEPNSQYQKKELGQLSDHVQWVRNNTDAVNIIPAFVGPVIGATPTSNPPDDFFVIALSDFKKLSEVLIAALADASAQSLHITIKSNLHNVLQERGLLWPDALRQLSFYRLKDLNL